MGNGYEWWYNHVIIVKIRVYLVFIVKTYIQSIIVFLFGNKAIPFSKKKPFKIYRR